MDAIRTVLTRRPFEPLRIKTTAGEVFEIRHPEMALLTRGAMIIVHADANGEPSDKVEFVSYLHIASVETPTGKAA